MQLLLFGMVGLLTSALAWLRDRAQDESLRAQAEARIAKERTELVVRRVSALQGLAAELTGALTREHITEALLTHGIASLQADGAAIFVIGAGGEELEAIASRGYAPDREQALAHVPLDLPTPATDVARTGEPVYIEDPAEYQARYGASLTSRGIAVQPRSVAAVPLDLEGRRFGVLGFTWDFAATSSPRTGGASSPQSPGSGPLRSNARASRSARSATPRSWRPSSAPSARASSSSSRTVRCDRGTRPRARLLGGRVESLADLLGRLRDAGGNAPRELPAGPTEFQLRDRRGASVEIAAYPVAQPGGPIRPTTVIVCRDMTAFRQGQGLRQAFLSLLSHELRTPVTTIYGGSSVLTRPGVSIREETRTEILGDIASEANRLYRLVEDLLVLAHFDEGLDLGGEPNLLQRLVPTVVAQERMRWPAIQFDVEVGPDLPAVSADETSVQQVLRNLLSNAAKYSDAGAVVDVRVEAASGGVAMVVRDHGAGIDANEADSLFEPFYRSPKTAKMAGGAGIGLYVSRRLVDAMGGRIWAVAAEGGGSEFTVVLPIYEGEFSD